MNAHDILDMVGYAKGTYVWDAQKVRSGQIITEKPHLSTKRIWLIAAVIALTLLLVGCAVIYILRVQDLKIGEHSAIYTEQHSSEKTEIKLDVLSLQGVKDSPNYLANQEWLLFTQSYEPELTDYWISEEQYWAYNVRNQVMVDKVDEICAKYGLNVIGNPWHEHVDCNEFLPLIGVKSLLKADSSAILHIPQGRFFPGGSFTIYGSLTLPETANPVGVTYDYVKKDVFYDVFAYISSNTTERNYTTADGLSLLLLESEESGMVMIDREDCFISLSIELPNGSSLENVADQFDFTIKSTPPVASSADARQQNSLDTAYGDSPDRELFVRDTYREYVEDILWMNDYNIKNGFDSSKIPQKEYAFWDLDENGTDDLLIIYNGRIQSVVGMENGKTDEGKTYNMILCQDNVLIDQMQLTMNECWYHIFRFANDGNTVFSNPKEQSIVRLKEVDGIWWRTSSTDHYAEFNVQITEAEAMKILNSYIPVALDTRPITEFEEP